MLILLLTYVYNNLCFKIKGVIALSKLRLEFALESAGSGAFYQNQSYSLIYEK